MNRSLGPPFDLVDASIDVRSIDLSALPTRAFGAWTISHREGALASSLERIAWQDVNLSVRFDSALSERFHVSFPLIADFVLDFAEKTISIGAANKAAPATIWHLLCDQIIPRIIAHQGNLVLHAAAVNSPYGAVIFVGPSGAGKSTVAASLHLRGYDLLGDDAIVVSHGSGGITGQAIYRSLRLFPDSIAELFDGFTKHSPVAEYTSKRNIIGLEGEWIDASTPIRAAFVLEPTDCDKIEVQSIAGSEACIRFVEHSFWLNPTDLCQTKRRMVCASSVASQIPTFCLAYPKDYCRLPDVHESIVRALDRMAS